MWSLDKNSAEFLQPTSLWLQRFFAFDPSDKFAAHQVLARIPTESIPALAAGLEEKFKNWGDPDEHAALAEKLLEIHRIATLLAEMREPEAEEVLNRFTASSPCLATKKIFFLAAKQRARFLRRVGDKHAPI